MPKSPVALTVMPPAAEQALRTLGENLAIATGAAEGIAANLGEAGGVLGAHPHPDGAGRPRGGDGDLRHRIMVNRAGGGASRAGGAGDDRGALENDVRDALKRRAVRSSASAEARLGRDK